MLTNTAAASSSLSRSAAGAVVFQKTYWSIKGHLAEAAWDLHVSTYGQSEVFLAGINGADSTMRQRMIGRELTLANLSYRLGQFASLVQQSNTDPGAYIAAVAAGSALRQMGLYDAAKAIWRLLRAA